MYRDGFASKFVKLFLPHGVPHNHNDGREGAATAFVAHSRDLSPGATCAGEKRSWMWMMFDLTDSVPAATPCLPDDGTWDQSGGGGGGVHRLSTSSAVQRSAVLTEDTVQRCTHCEKRHLLGDDWIHTATNAV